MMLKNSHKPCGGGSLNFDDHDDTTTNETISEIINKQGSCPCAPPIIEHFKMDRPTMVFKDQSSLESIMAPKYAIFPLFSSWQKWVNTKDEEQNSSTKCNLSIPHQKPNI